VYDDGRGNAMPLRELLARLGFEDFHGVVDSFVWQSLSARDSARRAEIHMRFIPLESVTSICQASLPRTCALARRDGASLFSFQIERGTL
jgi:hypothetical protein